MDMLLNVPWLFLLIAAFAGYFQTVTGFGLALLLWGWPVVWVLRQ